MSGPRSDFNREIQAVHELYVKQGGDTGRFRRILEEWSDELAITAALHQPTPLAYRAFKDCFDRAQAAGRAFQTARVSQ